MISIKTTEEIKTMRQAGKYLARVLQVVTRAVRPGVSTLELDQLAEKMILGFGAEPAFKNYAPEGLDKNTYPATICASVNSEVVHGIPRADRILATGDIIGLDCGLKLNGHYSDMAVTIGVGKISAANQKLLEVTRKALSLGIKAVKDGVHLGDVSAAIQKYVEKNGFSVVRNLSGHGIGKELHEEPSILNFGQPGTGPVLKTGMTLAIEPMVNAGSWKITTASDGWTTMTADGTNSAHFEHTILVTKNGADILTK